MKKRIVVLSLVFTFEDSFWETNGDSSLYRKCFLEHFSNISELNPEMQI